MSRLIVIECTIRKKVPNMLGLVVVWGVCEGGGGPINWWLYIKWDWPQPLVTSHTRVTSPPFMKFTREGKGTSCRREYDNKRSHVLFKKKKKRKNSWTCLMNEKKTLNMFFLLFIYFFNFLVSTAISQLEGSSIRHGLTLQLGDLVEITQICEGKDNI